MRTRGADTLDQRVEGDLVVIGRLWKLWHTRSVGQPSGISSSSTSTGSCGSMMLGLFHVALMRGCPVKFARSSPTRYAELVASLQESAPTTYQPVSDAVRDPLVPAETVLAARRRPMSERLELALSWNAVAAELRAGLLAATGRISPRG
jgi:hypothetical protein